MIIGPTSTLCYLLSAIGGMCWSTVSPCLSIYRPLEVPEIGKVTRLWRELAVGAGLKGLYIVGAQSMGNPAELGLDASTTGHLPDRKAMGFQEATDKMASIQVLRESG